jgi:hypothetical protein
MLLLGLNLNSQTKEDSTAILKVCSDYVEGWAEGNIDRFANSISPELVKRTIAVDNNGLSYTIYMSASRLISWVQSIKEEGIKLKDLEPGKELEPKIIIYDITGNFALVKTIVSKYGFFDYCQLAKFNGEWKIFNALYGPTPQKH